MFRTNRSRYRNTTVPISIIMDTGLWLPFITLNVSLYCM